MQMILTTYEVFTLRSEYLWFLVHK